MNRAFRGPGSKRARALGQSFLVNPQIARRIVDALEVKEEDLVVEVGPGRGILTELIAEKTRKLIAVELDRNLAISLKTKIPQVAIVVQDARTFPTQKLKEGYKLISNLPYSHAGPILRNFICGENPPQLSVVMVQKEVGERITSSPKSKTYGFLTVLMSMFSESEKLFNVSPGNFRPPPKVTSQVLRLKRKKPPFKEDELEKFLNFAKAIFNMRRKKMGTILKKMGLKTQVEGYGDKRPEELSVEELINIFRSIS